MNNPFATVAAPAAANPFAAAVPPVAPPAPPAHNPFAQPTPTVGVAANPFAQPAPTMGVAAIQAAFAAQPAPAPVPPPLNPPGEAGLGAPVSAVVPPVEPVVAPEPAPKARRGRKPRTQNEQTALDQHALSTGGTAPAYTVDASADYSPANEAAVRYGVPATLDTATTDELVDALIARSYTVTITKSTP